MHSTQYVHTNIVWRCRYAHRLHSTQYVHTNVIAVDAESLTRTASPAAQHFYIGERTLKGQGHDFRITVAIRGVVGEASNKLESTGIFIFVLIKSLILFWTNKFSAT